MKNHGKEQTEIVRVREIRDEDAEYRYTLLLTRSSKVASLNMQLYSIRIEMVSADGKRTSAESAELFSDREKASAFLNKLADNLATPINLAYIIEDSFAI